MAGGGALDRRAAGGGPSGRAGPRCAGFLPAEDRVVRRGGHPLLEGGLGPAFGVQRLPGHGVRTRPRDLSRPDRGALSVRDGGLQRQAAGSDRGRRLCGLWALCGRREGSGARRAFRLFGRDSHLRRAGSLRFRHHARPRGGLFTGHRRAPPEDAAQRGGCAGHRRGAGPCARHHAARAQGVRPGTVAHVPPGGRMARVGRRRRRSRCPSRWMPKCRSPCSAKSPPSTSRSGGVWRRSGRPISRMAWHARYRRRVRMVFCISTWRPARRRAAPFARGSRRWFFAGAEEIRERGRRSRHGNLYFPNFALAPES